MSKTPEWIIDGLRNECNQLIKDRDAELERCCKLVIDASLSTGHARNFEDLVKEILWQVEDGRNRERKLLEIIDTAPHDEYCIKAKSEIPINENCDCFKSEAFEFTE